MIKALFKVLLVFLAVLFIYSPAFANSIPAAAAPQPTTTMSIPIIQPLPVDDKTPELWLMGRVSLVGGEVSSSKQQYLYAEQNEVPIITRDNFSGLVTGEHLVRLEGPNVRLNTVRQRSGEFTLKLVPYVLPSTKDFVLQLAYEFGQQDCGELVVLDALRIVGDKMPDAASFFSVHLRGMAVDIRVRDIGERCETWMNTYLMEKEAEGKVDATREYWKMVRGQKVPNPHFHLVVPLEPRGPNLIQIADNTSVGAP